MFSIHSLFFLVFFTPLSQCASLAAVLLTRCSSASFVALAIVLVVVSNLFGVLEKMFNNCNYRKRCGR